MARETRLEPATSGVTGQPQFRSGILIDYFEEDGVIFRSIPVITCISDVLLEVANA